MTNSADTKNVSASMAETPKEEGIRIITECALYAIKTAKDLRAQGHVELAEQVEAIATRQMQTLDAIECVGRGKLQMPLAGSKLVQ
ncbi:MAG: hypothetical protein WCD70_09565 [Alphaproteobacteria bacterium]